MFSRACSWAGFYSSLQTSMWKRSVRSVSLRSRFSPHRSGGRWIRWHASEDSFEACAWKYSTIASLTASVGVCCHLLSQERGSRRVILLYPKSRSETAHSITLGILRNLLHGALVDDLGGGVLHDNGRRSKVQWRRRWSRWCPPRTQRLAKKSLSSPIIIHHGPRRVIRNGFVSITSPVPPGGANAAKVNTTVDSWSRRTVRKGEIDHCCVFQIFIVVVVW